MIEIAQQRLANYLFDILNRLHGRSSALLAQKALHRRLCQGALRLGASGQNRLYSSLCQEILAHFRFSCNVSGCLTR